MVFMERDADLIRETQYVLGHMRRNCRHALWRVEQLLYKHEQGESLNTSSTATQLAESRAERAAIVEVMTNLAIAHPQVMFRLVEQGRQVLSLAAAKDLIERLAQLYGVGKARAMRRVEYESGAFKVMGYAALPSITESSRSSQTVSVNGRWVRAESLTKGIDDAYRGTVPAGRYPPVALCVKVDPRQVDVNVHPTKQLVRFSDERE